MQEYCTSGSARGAARKGSPYRGDVFGEGVNHPKENLTHMRRSRITLLWTWSLAALLATTAITGGGADNAATYPTKPIRIVAPFSAGSILDVRARQIGERLSKNVGQPVIIDNRPGGTTIIGADLVAKAAPDGYTVLMASGATSLPDSSIIRGGYAGKGFQSRGAGLHERREGWVHDKEQGSCAVLCDGDEVLDGIVG